VEEKYGIVKVMTLNNFFLLDTLKRKHHEEDEDLLGKWANLLEV
jgi:hypothetical protein